MKNLKHLIGWHSFRNATLAKTCKITANFQKSLKFSKTILNFRSRVLLVSFGADEIYVISYHSTYKKDIHGVHAPTESGKDRNLFEQHFLFTQFIHQSMSFGFINHALTRSPLRNDYSMSFYRESHLITNFCLIFIFIYLHLNL